MSSSKGKRKIDDYEEYEDNKKVNMDQESSIQSSSKLAHLTGDIEARINQSSIGLKSLEQIKNTHCQIFNEKKLSPKKTTTNSIKYDVKPKIDNQRLSFFEEDDDDEIFDCKIYKNPDVDLSAASDSKDFLKNSSNLNSKNEWIEKVIKLKDQEIALSYNYWNGNNHTKIHKLKKGNTIEQFLKRIWPDLHCEYPELLNSTIYDLLFVKDDLILPHVNL
ncbi:hypothetical protein HZS_2097 [Henneguya salminicola]|nr:hypothetical protein HZS_2097 [Henneguya salminicola]